MHQQYTKTTFLSHEDIQDIIQEIIIFHWTKVSGTSIVTIKNSDAYILFLLGILDMVTSPVDTCLVFVLCVVHTWLF